MIKEIPVKIQKYLKTRKIQLTLKVNYRRLVRKDKTFRGLSKTSPISQKRTRSEDTPRERPEDELVRRSFV